MPQHRQPALSPSFQLPNAQICQVEPSQRAVSTNLVRNPRCLSSQVTLSAPNMTMECMEVTARQVEDIPQGNLRVPRADFVALWRLTDHLMVTRRGDWYVVGVAMTCRWLACTAVPSVLGGWELAWAPVTERSALAHEELIASELLAAERAAIRNPRGIEGRPGWLEGVVATLEWAWGGSPVPPLELPLTNVG